ncbi:hypothetical protein ACFO5K_23065 [Nocardia halotolerans]|uniref:Uncharacterized protein n=1 Tax=Nocardia halotolerans TaxID=1755878 RepID=A0ABV8VNQ8_9NOCA
MSFEVQLAVTGLLRRVADRSDGRRSLLELADRGADLCGPHRRRRPSIVR